MLPSNAGTKICHEQLVDNGGIWKVGCSCVVFVAPCFFVFKKDEHPLKKLPRGR